MIARVSLMKQAEEISFSNAKQIDKLISDDFHKNNYSSWIKAEGYQLVSARALLN